MFLMMNIPSSWPGKPFGMRIVCRFFTFRLSRLNISLKEREKNGWRESADRLGSLLINYKYHCVTIIIDLF